MEDKEAVRIPRESLHDQSERLTNKHIQTLGFLQELANENKALKARVQELEESFSECQDLHAFAKDSKEKITKIQESYMARADEINKMLSEKHRVEIMQLQDEKLEAERDLKEQILRMRHDIETLHAANKDLRITVADEEDSDEFKQKNKELVKQLEQAESKTNELTEELECLKGDLEVLQGKKSTDMVQLRELKSENKVLEERVQELQQTNNELEFRLDKALGDLKEKENNQEQALLIENLRDKVQELSQERIAGSQREKELTEMSQDLEVQRDAMKDLNQELQDELEKLLDEYGNLATEYDKLRQRSLQERDKKTFQDFVTLKREVKNLRDENQELKTVSKSAGVLTLKGDRKAPSQTKTQKKNPLPGGRSKNMLAISLSSQK